MDEARTSNGAYTRTELFSQLKPVFRKFSHGYKVVLVQFYLCQLDGTVQKGFDEVIRDTESLVAYLFDKSLSYSVCGIQTSDLYPYCYIFLVENEDNATTNIDSHFIEEISRLEFQKEPKR